MFAGTGAVTPSPPPLGGDDLAALLHELHARCPVPGCDEQAEAGPEPRTRRGGGWHPAELRAFAAKSLGRELRPAEFRALWTRLDANHDGVVDKEELKRAGEHGCAVAPFLPASDAAIYAFHGLVQLSRPRQWGVACSASHGV